MYAQAHKHFDLKICNQKKKKKNINSVCFEDERKSFPRRRVSLRKDPSFRFPYGRYTALPEFFSPLGNHFHLRSAMTTPRDRVERELSNKLFSPTFPSTSCRPSVRAGLPSIWIVVPPLSETCFANSFSVGKKKKCPEEWHPGWLLAFTIRHRCQRNEFSLEVSFVMSP